MDRWCPAPFERVYRMKWERLGQWAAEKPDRPLLVMMGSSRADHALQAGRLDGLKGSDGRPWSAFNFGVPAAGPIHEYLYLRQMLARGIRPRLLLVEFVSPLFNNAHSRQISEENWTYPEWVSATQLLQMAPYYVRPVRKGTLWLESRLVPWCVYRAFVRDWIYGQRAFSLDLALPKNPYNRWGYCPPAPLTSAERAARGGRLLGVCSLSPAFSARRGADAGDARSAGVLPTRTGSRRAVPDAGIDHVPQLVFPGVSGGDARLAGGIPRDLRRRSHRRHPMDKR